jgi:alpha-D-ribose 1-methylphosphonate 5-triphosphate synthase subunit PhnH
MTTTHLQGGFTDAPTQSAHAFRAILNALAMPGTLHSLTGAQPPAPLSIAAGTALLTLCDATTPLHLAGPADCQPVRDWVAFHIGAPLVAATHAQFALGRWPDLHTPDLHPVDRFAIGQPDYPDRAATLIVEMDALTPTGPTLSGPGIETTTQLSLPEVAAFQANRALFPLGFDCLFTTGSTIAGLPRSIQVRAA